MWVVTAISAGDAMMRETRSLIPSALSSCGPCDTLDTAWEERRGGCWVLFYHHSNPSLVEGRTN